jgi:hypothetical protein
MNESYAFHGPHKMRNCQGEATSLSARKTSVEVRNVSCRINFRDIEFRYASCYVILEVWLQSPPITRTIMAMWCRLDTMTLSMHLTYLQELKFFEASVGDLLDVGDISLVKINVYFLCCVVLIYFVEHSVSFFLCKKL